MANNSDRRIDRPTDVLYVINEINSEHDVPPSYVLAQELINKYPNSLTVIDRDIIPLILSRSGDPKSRTIYINDVGIFILTSNPTLDASEQAWKMFNENNAIDHKLVLVSNNNDEYIPTGEFTQQTGIISITHLNLDQIKNKPRSKDAKLINDILSQADRRGRMALPPSSNYLSQT
ncbi:hypothetical protein HYV64_01815 [Candidatus Shapirobacteria bacterium]|nr:hypothetical protein [Candidatus Shapirobacteria bacterium]